MRALITRSKLIASVAGLGGLLSLFLGLVAAGVAGESTLLIVGGVLLVACGVALPLLGAVRRIARSVAAVQYRTERSRDVAGSVGRMAEVVRSTAAALDDVRKRVIELQELRIATAAEGGHDRGDHEAARERSPFAPDLVAATQADRTLSRAEGRAGADFEKDPMSAAKFALLLAPREAPPLPTVGLIASHEFSGRLDAVARVEHIYPGFDRVELPADMAYLIIHDRALSLGVWAGAATAVGYEQFVQLVGAMKRARKSGAVVAYLDSGAPPGALTASVKSRASIVLRAGVRQDERQTRVLRHIEDILAEAHP